MSQFENAIKSEALATLRYLQEVDASVSAKCFNLLMMSAVSVHTDGAGVVQSIFADDAWKERGNIANCASMARANAAPLATKYSSIISDIIGADGNENITLANAAQLFAAELSHFGFTKLHHFKGFNKDMLSPKEREEREAKRKAEMEAKQKEEQERAQQLASETVEEITVEAPQEQPQEQPQEAPVVVELPVETVTATVPESRAVSDMEYVIELMSKFDDPEFFTTYNAIKAMADERRKAAQKLQREADAHRKAMKKAA